MQDEVSKGIEYLERISDLEKFFNGKKVAMIGLSPSFDRGYENYLDFIVRSLYLSGIDLRVWNPRFEEELNDSDIHRMIKNNMTSSDAKQKKKRCLFTPKHNSDSELGLRDVIKSSEIVNIFYSSEFNKPDREENFDYILALNKNARIFQLDGTLDFLTRRGMKKLALKDGVCYVDLVNMAFADDKRKVLAHTCMDAMHEEYSKEKVKRI